MRDLGEFDITPPAAGDVAGTPVVRTTRERLLDLAAVTFAVGAWAAAIGVWVWHLLFR